MKKYSRKYSLRNFTKKLIVSCSRVVKWRKKEQNWVKKRKEFLCILKKIRNAINKQIQTISRNIDSIINAATKPR